MACRHVPVHLGGDAVLWVIDQTQRCGACLLATDEDTVARVRGRLSGMQAAVVAMLDAGVQLIEQGLTDEQQAADMIAEGSPVHEDAL